MRLFTSLLSGLLAVAALSPALATTYDVLVGPSGNNLFSPQTLTISTGDAVRFVYKSGIHPTVSDSSPAAWATFILDATAPTNTITFNKAGVYPYHCSSHAFAGPNGTFTGMIGTITVQSALPTLAAQAATGPVLTCFPNPARGQVGVQFATPRSLATADYKLRLSNVLGREVRLVTLRPETADNQPLDLSGLPAGLYFYSLLMNDKVLHTSRLTVL